MAVLSRLDIPLEPSRIGLNALEIQNAETEAHRARILGRLADTATASQKSSIPTPLSTTFFQASTLTFAMTNSITAIKTEDRIYSAKVLANPITSSKLPQETINEFIIITESSPTANSLSTFVNSTALSASPTAIAKTASHGKTVGVVVGAVTGAVFIILGIFLILIYRFRRQWRDRYSKSVSRVLRPSSILIIGHPEDSLTSHDNGDAPPMVEFNIFDSPFFAGNKFLRGSMDDSASGDQRVYPSNALDKSLNGAALPRFSDSSDPFSSSSGTNGSFYSQEASSPPKVPFCHEHDCEESGAIIKFTKLRLQNFSATLFPLLESTPEFMAELPQNALPSPPSSPTETTDTNSARSIRRPFRYNRTTSMGSLQRMAKIIAGITGGEVGISQVEAEKLSFSKESEVVKDSLAPAKRVSTSTNSKNSSIISSRGQSIDFTPEDFDFPMPPDSPASATFSTRYGKVTDFKLAVNFPHADSSQSGSPNISGDDSEGRQKHLVEPPAQASPVTPICAPVYEHRETLSGHII